MFSELRQSRVFVRSLAIGPDQQALEKLCSWLMKGWGMPHNASGTRSHPWHSSCWTAKGRAAVVRRGNWEISIGLSRAAAPCPCGGYTTELNYYQHQNPEYNSDKTRWVMFNILQQPLCQISLLSLQSSHQTQSISVCIDIFLKKNIIAPSNHKRDVFGTHSVKINLEGAHGIITL